MLEETLNETTVKTPISALARGSKKEVEVQIKAPNMQRAHFEIRGSAPYVQHRFAEKARKEIMEKHKQGTEQGKKTRAKPPRDFDHEFLEACYLTKDGKHGQPATAYRNAMISACRIVGFTMTRAKLALFIEPDDFDARDGTPLVLITGKPERHESPVRLADGTMTIAVRPMWREWSARLRVRFDGDMFQTADIANLLVRAGLQVGVGEGRADSKKSNGIGWGFFEVTTHD